MYHTRTTINNEIITSLNFTLRDADMIIPMLLTYQQKAAEVQGEGVGPWNLAAGGRGEGEEGPGQT